MERLSQGLLVLGVAVVVMSSIVAATVRKPLTRLHLLAPVTSLGAPLIGAAVMLDSGIRLSTAWIFAITAAIVLTGPVVQVAIGHAIAHREPGSSR
jgi:multicomponent Na+:H+ antiporter subunit G